jgi:DNA gyrase/topoisomerase IV subunit A
MKKRVFMTEGSLEQTSGKEQLNLVLLGEERTLTAVTLPITSFTQANSLLLADLGITTAAAQGILAGLDEQLLLVTSKYRFLLVTPRQLLDLQALDMQFSDLHRLAERETICTFCSWTHTQEQERLLLATSRGFARAYPLRVLRENIEAPVPLKLDNPLPGLPIFAQGAQSGDEFLLVTANGRGLRWSIQALRISGTQVVNCGKDDRVTAAELVQSDSELLLLTEDGYGRRLLAQWIPFPSAPNRKGKSLIARRSPTVAIAKTGRWAVTKRKLTAIDAAKLPLEDSTKSRSLFKLLPAETVKGVLSLPLETRLSDIQKFLD